MTLTYLSENEEICLRFLSMGVMEANSRMLGEEIIRRRTSRGGSNYAFLGANAAGRLKRRGLIHRLPDLNAWRISKAGREYLTTYGQ